MRPQRIGSFLLKEQLGCGGAGVVTRAWDEAAGEWVAIKSVAPERLSPRQSARLRDEARAAAAIDHPAVVRVHGVLTVAGCNHIVMELVEGQSLAELLAVGPLDVDRATDLARQIAEGLAAAHREGVVHGDLKAENVMVSTGGRVKILDFGLSAILATRRPQQGGAADVVVGTARAMSPEQASGYSVDHRSDLFALGTMLYHMVTGRHPFTAADPLQTMLNVVESQPSPARRLAPHLSETLSGLIQSLLEKDPDRRPASAADVARVLADSLAVE